MKLLTKVLRNKNMKAGTYYLIGNLFDKAITFLTIPIFTRLMSTTDYGIVNTYLSWVSILSVIIGLSLGSSIRSAYLDFLDDLDGYISSIFFLSLVNFLVSGGTIIFIIYRFNQYLDIVIVVLCLIQSFMSHIINSMTIYFMMSIDYLKRTILIAMPNIVVAIVSIVLLLKMNSNKYMGRIIPYVIVLSLVGTYYMMHYFIKGRTFIKLKYWKYAISLSLPLIFHGLSVNVLAISDRTMITLYKSASETGVYSLIYSLGMIATIFTASIESVWIPWFTQKIKNGEKNIINRYVKIYIEIVLVIIILILMVSPEVLIFIAPKEYWSGNLLIPPILLASFFIFLYSISVNLEYYYKSTKIIAINTFIAAVVNFVLNFIFIPRYGAIAAAYTTVVAYVVSFGIHCRTARRLDKELFPFSIYVKPILIIISFAVISYLLIDLTFVRWGIALVELIIYLILLFKNNKFDFLLSQ